MRDIPLDEWKTAPLSYRPARRNPLRELSVVGLVFAVIAVVTLWYHYKLPEPLEETSVWMSRPPRISDEWYRRYFAGELDSTTAPMYVPVPDGAGKQGVDGNVPLHSYFSEANGMLTIRHLAEDIGYRVVGTQQHIDAEDWLKGLLQRYTGWHDTGAASGATYRTEVELFTQMSDGSHRFDILGHAVWKQYYSMSNLIVRLSDGSEESKNNTLLINAHIDSTVPSPGGADDGAGVAIMLEVLRILTLPGAPRLRHGIVLLFNNGEESLQDASHLYMTQHNETNAAVRAVVNLEACGVSGPSLLFQATDEALIEAYARVPHPYGNVLANDVFSSGVIGSDTDFRQFEQYGGGLPGLDMAIVGSSYLYHTRRDVPQHIERGVLQHFGENVLSLVESLAVAEDSKLAALRRLPPRLRKLLPVYFSMFGRFIVVIPARMFKGTILALAVMVNFYLHSVNQAELRVKSVAYALLASAGTIASLVMAVAAAGSVAYGMRVLGRPLSWFSHEAYVCVLYAPPAVAGIVAVQMVLPAFVERSRRPYLEYASYTGPMILFTFLLMVMNSLALGSAYLFLIMVLAKFIPIAINDFFLVGLGPIASNRVDVNRRVAFATHLMGAVSPATFGAQGVVSFLDMLVPLMGRVGVHVPVDYVMAALVAVLCTLNALWLVPLLFRYGPVFTRRVFFALLAVSVASMAFFVRLGEQPFDALHPRRLYMNHVENITSGEWHVVMSALDSAPTNHAMVRDLEHVLLQGHANASLSWDKDGGDTDVDVLYPLSDFMEATRTVLPDTPERAAASRDPARWREFRVSCSDLSVDPVNHTRTLEMTLSRPGIAWSTLSFDADVLDWSFSEAPPSGPQRHYLKDVSRLDAGLWKLRIQVRLSPEQVDAWKSAKKTKPLKDTLLRSPPVHAARPAPKPTWRFPVHYSGLDAFGMFPHHKDTSMDKLSMQQLGALDAVLLEKYPEVDAMLVSVIAGVAEC
ncbi:hypothetical protein MSPP1_003631 [Malassezia sp. CBS 17886]|nr:hypothetical protein MSPP1_003631 [Malassezia sp. CBS 17886]